MYSTVNDILPAVSGDISETDSLAQYKNLANRCANCHAVLCFYSQAFLIFEELLLELHYITDGCVK